MSNIKFYHKITWAQIFKRNIYLNANTNIVSFVSLPDEALHCVIFINVHIANGERAGKNEAVIDEISSTQSACCCLILKTSSNCTQMFMYLGTLRNYDDIDLALRATYWLGIKRNIFFPFLLEWYVVREAQWMYIFLYKFFAVYPDIGIFIRISSNWPFSQKIRMQLYSTLEQPPPPLSTSPYYFIFPTKSICMFFFCNLYQKHWWFQ